MAEETQNIVRETLPQIVATIFGTLMAVSDGMSYGWTSPIIPYLVSEKSHIKMTMHEAEWLETLVLFGAISGLPFTIYFVNKIGRKQSMLLAAAVGCLCWIAILFGNSKEYLYVGRFFSGMAGDMCFVAAPMYIAEIAHPKIRGFLSGLIYLMMVSGVLIVYTVGYYASFYVSPIIGVVLTLTQMVVFSFMPESPYYYILKGNPEKAKKSLRCLRANPDINAEIMQIAAAVERQQSERGRPQDLVLVTSNRRALLIMAFLNSAQHFVGISVMLMNLHIILAEAKSTYIDGSVAAIIFAGLMLISALTASLIIDRFGRKVLLLWSGVLTSICLLTLTIYFQLQHLSYNLASVSWIPSVCVMAYAVAFKIGLGIVPIVVTAEIFPTSIKAIGMTIADVMYVSASLISVWLYQILFSNYGIHVPFYVFTICSVIITVYTKLYVPETKGKTLEEIQVMLKGRNNEGLTNGGAEGKGEITEDKNKERTYYFVDKN